MDYKTRMITEKDREEFNNFISSHPRGHILQSYEWGEVKAATHWVPFRFLVEKEGRPAAAVSILERRVPLLNKKIFYAPRGPVLDYNDTELFDYLLGEVDVLSADRGAFILKIDPPVPSANSDIALYLKNKGFQAQKNLDFEGIQPRYVFRLDIRRDIDDLFANLHSKTRYNIRLAERRGVTIKGDCTREDLKAFYNILEVTAKRDGFLVRSLEYFETLWEYLVEKGLARLFMAQYQGRDIAGTLALIFGDTVWYLYGASGNQYRNVMPNYLLQWTMISWAKEMGCSLYDFRGVPGNLTEDNPLYGLYRFKKGFNGDYVEFIGEYDFIYSPAVHGMYRAMEKIYTGGIKRVFRLLKT